MPTPTLFTSFLTMLGVPHTASYSNNEYKSYPPRLAFMAFEDLLYEYKVDRRLVKGKTADEATLRSLKVPCVVRTVDGRPLILKSLTPASATFISADGAQTMPIADFLKSWSGDAIEATRTRESTEPQCAAHRITHAAGIFQHYAFWVLLPAIACFFFISNGLYKSWSLILLTLFYSLGVMFSWMLTLKQNNVQSSSAEAVCSMIQPHGCNTVVNSDQGIFLGIFHWSEIGLTFFTVSLGALLLHPQTVNYLAYISILCLPYTVWSVYTQHWRIHSWCTLCLCVQALFWLIFGVALGGSHMHHLFPLRWDLAILLASYALVLIFFHKIVPAYFAYELRSGTPAPTADPLPEASSSSASSVKKP